MKLIVGLGNPGGEYESTRHNIGFMVVEKLGHELVSPSATWADDKIHKAFIARAGDVILVKPTTFMNNSGFAVSTLLHYYKLSPEDLWVVHDDIDLPLGKIRIREKGGHGGHHGVESIIGVLKTDVFVRFRLGIGRGNNIVDYVLSRFHRNEAGQMKHLVKHSTDAVRMALLEGLDKAQNRFH